MALLVDLNFILSSPSISPKVGICCVKSLSDSCGVPGSECVSPDLARDDARQRAMGSQAAAERCAWKVHGRPK